MTGSFLDAFPGFVHWVETSDMWRNTNATFVFDINLRGVRIDDNGVVSIHPDAAGSTSWFADILRDGTGPALAVVPS